jgi:hypothetical protein
MQAHAQQSPGRPRLLRIAQEFFRNFAENFNFYADAKQGSPEPPPGENPLHLERSFEHVLDEGGMRRATLRGKDNLDKRYKIAATCFNLSLLLRTLWEWEPPNSGRRKPIACLELLSLTFSSELCGFAAFTPEPRISFLRIPRSSTVC